MTGAVKYPNKNPYKPGCSVVSITGPIIMDVLSFQPTDTKTHASGSVNNTEDPSELGLINGEMRT